MWWIGVAMAQDVGIDDFAGPTLSWTLGAGTSFGVPPTPWDGPALVCDVAVLGGSCDAESAAFVVTHDTIADRSTAEGDVAIGALVLELTDASGAVSSAIGEARAIPGSWGVLEVAIVDGCGSWGAVQLSATSAPAAVQPPTVYVDDLTFTGAVCQSFVDTDGDGACLQGLDADGDGLCITPGEAVGPGVVVDPDEGSADTGTGGTTPTTDIDSGAVWTDTGTPSETKDTSDTGTPTDTAVEPPLHTGEPPVHEPGDSDTGGVIVKEGGCECGIPSGRGAATFGWVLALAGLRRRRARSSVAGEAECGRRVRWG